MKNNPRITVEISELIAEFLLDELSEPKQKQLEDWITESDHNHQLFENICNQEIDLNKLHQYGSNQHEIAFQGFLAQRKKIERRHLRQRIASSLKYAAIFIMPLMIAGVLWWVGSRPLNKSDKPVLTELALQKDKPILTLADGKEIIVDKTSTGLNSIYGLRVAGYDSTELVYARKSIVGSQLQYHILRTPAQCDYHFVLSDGTKVWINAKSSIKYPVTFGADERTVYASGEIYLEVAKDATRPFYVVTKDLKIEVLGTSFNVNAYEDEDFVAVTLVEGKVAAHAKNNSYKLLPNKQLHFDKQSQVAQIVPVNVNDVIAWKDGRYIFRGQKLHEVAKVLQRWYKVSIVFDNKAYGESIYTGIVYKEESLGDFINRLNASSVYNCYIENNIVHIK